MVYTVTFNPSIDHVVRLGALRPGRVNRATEESLAPGGKGINVSVVLHNLGHDSCALGFVAGFTGRQIERMVAGLGVRSDFVGVPEGLSRINLKVHAREETEINGVGPAVGEADLEALCRRLDALGSGDALVLAGSVPSTLPDDIYERVLGRLDGRGVDFVVDAERDLLVRSLAHRPFLVKPNNHELGDIFGVDVSRREQVEPYARRLQERGARNVLVSMAGEGAVLVPERGDVVMGVAPRGVVVNSVGAGDSMVAGFLAGYQESGGDNATAFWMGVCAGSATAFKTGLATRPEVEALLSAMGA